MKPEEDIVKIENSPFFIGGKGIPINNNSLLCKIQTSLINFNIRFYHVIDANNFKYLIDVLNTDYNLMLDYRNCGIKSITDARMEIRFFVRKFYNQNELNIKTNNHSEIDNIIFYSLSEKEKSNLKFIPDYSLQNIKLPNKTRKYLTNNPQIKTINDLANIDKSILENKKNLGFKAFIGTQKIIVDLSKKDERELRYLYSDQLIPILELVDQFLERIEIRDLNIIVKRWGNNDITSLQLIAEEYGLTRERIRQIISRVIKKFKERVKDNYNLYAEQFLAIIISRPEAITFDELNNYSFIARKFKPNVYLGILSEVFEEVPFSNFMLKSFDQYLNRNLKQNTKIVLLYKKLLDNNYPFKKITLYDLFSINNIQAPVDKLLLSKILILSHNFKFIFIDGKYYIIKPGPINQIAKDILEYGEQPLAVNEIIDIIKTYYLMEDKYDSVTSIISILKQNKEIYQLDRYIFGLKKHFSYSEELWQSICNNIKEFMQKLQRQTNAVELFENILPLYSKLRSKYELVYLIRSDPEIVDLGFFNFGLIDSGATERIKICDEIKNVFLKNSLPKHFTEIQKEIFEKRFLRVEGMSNILNSQNYLINYSGGYWGLKEKHLENLFVLAQNQTYIKNLIDYELFPESNISRLIYYFENTLSEDLFINFIKKSSLLEIYDDDNFVEPFVISKKWSIVKTVRCILSNSKEPIYWDELVWFLKDKDLILENSDRYKIKSDKYIKISDNKLSYINIEIQPEDSKVILNECYNLLLNTSTMWTINRLNSLINNEFIEIDLDQLKLLLNDDDRFIIIDNKTVTLQK